ncbi:MAG: restriction system protein [Chloroflexota bacterium]|nr:restriction system protein [Chloroflexota bacterium]
MIHFSRIRDGALAAAGSALRKVNQPAEPSAVAAGEDMSDMGWGAVQKTVTNAFHRHGYSVLPASASDSPVDLVLHRGDDRVFVQCRHWAVWEVADRAVRDFAAYVAGAGAQAGYMLTTGQFSDEARAYARERGVELVDGSALPALLAAA